MSAQVEWDLRKYLVSLGLSQREAELWVYARQENQPLKANSSDALGEHLDRVWKRSSVSANMATGQIPISRKYRYSQGRLATRRMAITILWAYSFAIWIYVVAFQIANPRSPYWPVAWWLPIRMDYFGEIAFMLSFVFAISWVKLSSRAFLGFSGREH